jgi:hypothetical protein
LFFLACSGISLSRYDQYGQDDCCHARADKNVENRDSYRKRLGVGRRIWPAKMAVKKIGGCRTSVFGVHLGEFLL